jgi:hypothetical protein
MKRLLLPVVLPLVLAGCGNHSSSSPGSGGEPGTAGSADSGSAVAYAVCIRSHGVPRFPDPDSSGNLTKADASRLGVGSAQLQAAEQACQHLLPDQSGAINTDSVQQCMEAGDCPRALAQQVLSEERGFAQCMRSKGVPHWPDPSIDSQGRPVFVISISKLGFDPYSHQVWPKGNQCAHLMPDLPGLPAAVSP